MEALETSREVMSQALLFQKHDLKSRVQSFEDDWTLACVNHQAQVKRARLWILAPARDVGFLVRLGRVLSITFWSVYLVVQAGQTGTVGICDGFLKNELGRSTGISPSRHFYGMKWGSIL
jgi:hypothetical protein